MQDYILLWVEENYSYFDLEPILLNYGIKSKKRWGYGIDEGLVFGKGFHAEFYLPEEELKEEAQDWYKFLTNRKKVELLLGSIEESGKAVRDQIKKLVAADLSRLSSQELWETYDSYGMQLNSLMNCYIITQPHRIAKLETELIDFLKRRKVKDVNNCFAAIVSPPKKIVFSSLGNRILKESFSELLRKEDSVIDKNLLNKEMYKEKAANSKEKDKILLEIRPDPKTRNIIDTISILGHERMKMRLVWMPALYFNELFLIEFKRRYQIKKEELRLYEYPELQHLIMCNEKLDNNIIELRKKGFLKHLKDNEIITYEGNIAQDVLNKLVKEDEEIKEFKGMVASKGYAKGKVIVLSYRESQDHAKKIKGMKKGNIIVTEMTRPNIITACQKAGAIVTDEGGILCHAAIISREMKKPCVIGTKLATKVLKDGDIVEVDADKGIIKKLMKK